jgi:hypothetical protein
MPHRSKPLTWLGLDVPPTLLIRAEFATNAFWR